MPRFTPANFIPLLLLFIFCATNVLASPTLHQDMVYVSGTSDNINSVEAADGKPSDYTEENANLEQVAETPDPTGNVKGLLYDSGDACSGNLLTSPNPSKLPNIALIKQSASCSVYDQIYAVQQQGAIGAIIYADGATSTSKSSKSIKIPVFSVKGDIGDGLAKALQDLGAAQATAQGQTMIRVAMIPASSSLSGGWQIAIIVIGAILAASFLVSVLVHCRLYQLRRRERSLMVAQHEASVNAKLNLFILEKSVLKSFPTKVYNKNEETTAGSGSSKSANNPEMCSICLEEFSDGETLRVLPCSHMYHIECVDKWLTTKSSYCPLCKQDATPPEIAEKREKKYAHAVQVQDRLDNIYGTSSPSSTGESSRFSRVLEWFGYGESSSRGTQSRARPTGGNNLFAIQELPPAHNDNLNRIV